VKKANKYMMDLREIEGEGDFPCPKCGATISPEDESEQIYTIQELKMKGEQVEELIILCNNCGSKIHVLGFTPEHSLI